MDQIKIGRFIAERRKEESLTQRQLADILGISDKTVSKWETGNGLPKVSLMVPLCDRLDISVNELLSGERLTDSDYKRKAEENMMDLVKEKEESRKKILLSVIICALTLLPGIALSLTAVFVEMERWLRAVLIIIGVVAINGGAFTALALNMRAGTYECGRCKRRFVPAPGSYIMGLNLVTVRLLKCPNCGEVSFCRKRLTH